MAWTGVTWKALSGTPAAAAILLTRAPPETIVLRLLVEACASALLPLATMTVVAERPVLVGWVTVRGAFSSFARKLVSTLGAASDAPRPRSRDAEKAKVAWRDRPRALPTPSKELPSA